MISDKFKRFLSESEESRMSLREAKRICEKAGYTVTESEKVQPKTKEELQEIIKKTIKEQGPRCDLNFIDTSLIDDMAALFCYSEFNGDISKWDVSNVTDMGGMFLNSEFNGDISKWDVSKVEDMRKMFAYSKFNRDISKWDVSSVRNMERIFFDSPLEDNPPSWYED